MAWKIIYYEITRRNSPVFKFIQSFDMKTRARIIDTLTLLEENGPSVSLPYFKKLSGTKLWEIRILGENNLRILYATYTGQVFILLHGFKKKKQKTDRYEIKTAILRLNDYILKNKSIEI